jgi:uncharacterized coiled-coil DUF342 family protein
MPVLKDLLETLMVTAHTSKMVGDIKHGFTGRPRDLASSGASERAQVARDARLKHAQGEYDKLLKRVEDLQSKDVLTVDEEKSLQSANDELKSMSEEIESIKSSTDKMNAGFDDTASGIRDSSKEMDKFGSSTDEAGKKVGALKQLLAKAKESAVALAAGYSLASLFSKLNDNTNPLNQYPHFSPKEISDD